jgi:endonuclease-3
MTERRSNNFMKANAITIEQLLEVAERLFPNARCELDFRTPFQLAVAVILSAQTTDLAVNRITPALFEAYPDAKTMAEASLETLENLLRTIGLYRNKARHLQDLAKTLVTTYDGKLPDDFEVLCRLPGIGRKTANVIVSVAFGQPGLAVDTHVLRVTQRVGLVSLSDDPTKAELKLKRKIPKSRWSSAHHAILFFGRYHCMAKKPACATCPLADRCRYVQNLSPSTKKVH